MNCTALVRAMARISAFPLLLPAALLQLTAARAYAQPAATQVAASSRSSPAATAARHCVALHWFDHGIVCGAEGSRRGELVGAVLAGGFLGAMSAFPAGLMFEGRCNNGVASAAGRGALAGMAVAYIGTLMLDRVSRSELRRRDSTERVRATRSRAVRTWRAVRPAVAWLGTAAAGGAVIGAIDGARRSTDCGTTAGSGAARGAAVYAASSAAAIGTGLLLVKVRF